MATAHSGNLGGWSTGTKAHGPDCHKKTYASRCVRCGADVRGWECEHGKKGFLDVGTDPPVEHACATARATARREHYIPQGEQLREVPCPDCGEKVKVRQLLGITWHLDRETLRAHECRSASA